MMSESNESRMGLTLSKPKPELLNISISIYEDAIRWVRDYARGLGYDLTSVRVDPYLRTWYFYEGEHLTVRLQQDTMDGLFEQLNRQQRVLSRLIAYSIPVCTTADLAEYQVWMDAEEKRRREAEDREDGA